VRNDVTSLPLRLLTTRPVGPSPSPCPSHHSRGSWATPTLALYVEQILHLDGRGFGLLLACMATGFAGAATVSRPVISRLGYPLALRTAVTTEIACKLLLGVVPGHWAVVAVVLMVRAVVSEP
jgi:hypothetical protein